MNTRDQDKVSAVILVGGPTRGTRFRPLSLHTPKPLFKIGGSEMIYHHCEALAAFGNCLESIYLVGSFEESTFETFVDETSKQLGVKIRYLKESEPLGTAGGIFKMKNIVLQNSDYLFVLHSDICCMFPLKEILQCHKSHGRLATMMGTKIPKEFSGEYGCYVKDKTSNRVVHYVEKPKSFVSNTINAGIYCFSMRMFESNIQRNISVDNLCDFVDSCHEGHISMELDIIPQLISTEDLYVYEYDQFWRSIKDAGSAVYCNEQYLLFYAETKPHILTSGLNIVGHVIIDPTAQVDESAKIGPNVYVGPNVIIGKGVRLHNSIIMDDVHINDHACVMYSIVSDGSHVGKWTRLEGIKNESLENSCKRCGITILGQNVIANHGIIVRNCIVMPHKHLMSSQFDEILL